MATVYSLVCWGGRDGKNVTASSATDYITLTDHGCRNSTALTFASGTLPTAASGGALAVGTTYYAKYISTSTFELYRETGLTTKIDFTSNGSSLVMRSAYRYALTTAEKLRYGTAGSERIYNGLAAWHTARAGSSSLDTEVCEIGEAWTEFVTSALNINTGAAATVVTTRVNGTRSAGFHGGVVGAGYIFDCTYGSTQQFGLSKYYTTIDGFTSKTTSVNASPGVNLNSVGSQVINMIIWKAATATAGSGIVITAASASIAKNNIIIGHYDGIENNQYVYANVVANNTVVKNVRNGICTTGGATSSVLGYYYNNISIGNLTNWGTTPTDLDVANKNAGASGNTPWQKGTGSTSITMATTDFMDYANNDFRPALSTSPQVETAVEYYGALPYDVADGVRPNYKNGAAAYYDVGAFEFDHGFGLAPVSYTLDFTGLVSGSQVVVYTTATTTERTRNNSTGTTLSWDAAATGVIVDYTVMKAGYLPIRVTGLALTTTSTPVTILQQLDRAYVAASGLTFSTNAIVNVTSRVVTSMQVTAATTVQNWYSYLIESWIASATNTTLKNVPFPIVTFGEASFTIVSGIEFSDGATSIAKFTRDGLRYASDSVGVTATAIWAAILTLDTAAGLQVKYRQTTGGSIVSAANTGPMDQLVQVYGDASHGNFDYRNHMVLKVQKVGYTQPKPNLVATYGNLADGLYVAGLAPTLQYACTNADLDAVNLVLNNSAKTCVVSAAHSGADLYQRAQWWANQDAQWDSDVPLTTTDGSTYTLATGWALSGVSYISSGTFSGGTCTLSGPGTYAAGFSGTTVVAQAEGIYVFTAGTITLTTAPTVTNARYILGTCTLTGTLTVNNTNAYPIVVEVPSGTTTSSAGNTGGAITFEAPGIYQSVAVAGAVAGTRIQIYDTTSATELYNGTPTFPYTWTDGTAAAATRAIRVRASYVSGATAKTFIEANIGTCATSGAGKDISYLVSQTNDTTYNSNAVDGSVVTGITIVEGATDRVQIAIAGGSVSWAQIYAYQCYWLFTSTGIQDDGAFIAAPDTANYTLTGFKIKNTHASTPLVLTGGYGVDSTGSVSVLYDTTGTSIFPAPAHVVPYQTTGTYAITGDIATVIAGINAVPAAVLSAAQTTPIHADIKKVNNVTVTGTGATGTEWGPA